jgi:hypothetical protein
VTSVPTEAVSQLRAALYDAVQRCGCNLRERLSGHLIDCPAPQWQELLDATEQPHEPGGWQPIATAPLDGTQVLMLYAPTRPANTLERVVCKYNAAHGWFTVPGHFWLKPDELRGWMPLPSFPETKAEPVEPGAEARDADREMYGDQSEHGYDHGSIGNK